MHNKVCNLPADEPFAPAEEQKLIMLVDDDPIFRNVTKNFLTAQGYKVVEAEDGLDGLKRLRECVPDLILCDLSMPVLDGLEFVEEVSLEYPSLPTIVVSATEDISDVAKALRFGIKDFLPKPISDHRNLANSIDNTLDESFDRLSVQRDFATQWFRVDNGDVPEEQELHWHLKYLKKNPNAAKELLHALLPEADSSQGVWKVNYRLLQSTDMMPMVFDYAWLMNGQLAFYLVDSGSHETDGASTTLLVRALFHDYLRQLKNFSADLKDLAYLIEKGLTCSSSVNPVKALFGLVDVSAGTMSILPAGLESQWSNDQLTQHIAAGVDLGENCVKNFMTKDLPVGQQCRLSLSRLGSSSFSLDIVQDTQPKQ